MRSPLMVCGLILSADIVLAGADFENRLDAADKSRERMDPPFGSGNLGNHSPAELENFVRGPSHKLHIVRNQSVSERRPG